MNSRPNSRPHPTLRSGLIILACALLAGCLNVQLGGAVTGATITVTPLRDTAEVLEQTATPSLQQVRSDDGPERWDARRDIGRFVFLGNIVLDESLYDPNALYLVTATGGFDQDANADNALDAEASPVTGRWHAILTGEQLFIGKVSALTEAVYRQLEPELDNLSDAEIIQEMDTLARSMVADVDASGSVDYVDVLAWHRHFNANRYLRDISLVNELSDAVRDNATVATIRELSLAVVGRIESNADSFAVSGTITIPPITRVDSDVNDPAAPRESNDSLGEAQPLENPVVLGGYANQAGAGSSGSSSSSGDVDDFYSIELGAGQLVSLVMSDDPQFNDLDLFLYQPDGTLIDASLGTAGFEQLVVPADGPYVIQVNTFRGASNYQLSVGSGIQQLRQQHLRLSDDFIPGQLIARFKNRRGVDSMNGRERFTGMRVRAGGLRRANLMQMAQDPGEQLLQRKLKTLYAMKRLQRKPELAAVGLNYRVRPAAVPNDPFYSQQSWHYEQISLPAAWDRSLGDDVIVAVVDTGIRRNHPDLIGQQVTGWDFFDDDSNPEDPGDSVNNQPSSFHGTHVAGTVAAASNNSQGVAGVAWNAKIMPLRVLGPGGGTTYDVLQGVRFAAGLENDSGTLPERRADIINLSLAGGGFNSFDQNLYSQVAALGVIIVAAAGNDSSSQFAYPASYENVISVSAVNINRSRAAYSNFGSAVDVAAPGGDSSTFDANNDGIADLVLSTGADDSGAGIQDGYILLQGTSMASPHVAGVAALMKSVYPELTSGDFEALLTQGLLTDDLGLPARDNTFGWGLINANKAVQVAESLARGGEITLEPNVATSATTLNFGSFAELLPLTVSNIGTGTLVVECILADDPWVSITESAINANGVGTYSVRVDRSQLAVGRHFSAINIETNDRDVNVQVVLEQPDPSTLTGGNAGIHYVLLLDADTEQVVHESQVAVSGGTYSYSFSDVLPGRYQIIGGSDADNDLFICDPGEACGAWPVLDSELPVIEVIQDLEGLNFSSSFSNGIVSTEDMEGGAAKPTRRSGYRSNRGTASGTASRR